MEDLPDDLSTTEAYEAYEAFPGKRGRVDRIDLPDAQAISTNDGSMVRRRDT